jgi:phage N-6-adenine-methyltransferase
MKTDSWNAFLSSSGKVEYSTPPTLYKKLDELLGPFDLDAAATAENTKVPGNFISKEEDALTVDWASRGSRIFVNHPYGSAKDNLAWVRKAIEASQNGATVAMLVFCRCDVAWFKEAITHASQLILISGRVKFGGSKTNAPFGSCVFVFRPNRKGPVRLSLIEQEKET